jgi:hypothetical protein
VRAYCETDVELVLATKIQLSSLRIAIEFAPTPAATGAPTNGVKAPVVGLIRKPEMLLEPVFTTYKKLPYASTARGPGTSPAGYGENGGPVVTGFRLKSAFAQGGVERRLIALQIV